MAALTAALTTAPASAGAASAPGRITFAFPGAGETQPQAGSTPIWTGALATLPGGRVVVAGPAGGETIGVAELNANGTLDRSFGHGGLVEVQAGPVSGVASTLAAPGGRIVVVGVSAAAYSEGPLALVVMLNANGSLDTAFGRGGIAIPGGFGLDCANGGCPVAAVQSNGGILLVGQTAAPASSLSVARLTPTGALDGSFGSGGFAAAPDAGPGIYQGGPGDTLAVGPGGVLMVGGGGGHSLLAALTPAGTPDRHFDGGRPVDLPLPPQMLLAEPDGSVLVAGSGPSGGDLLVARYTTSGALDRAWGSAGIATASPMPTPIEPPGETAGALLAGANGSTLVVTFPNAGAPQTQKASPARVVTLTAAGRADPAHGGAAGQVAQLPFGGGDANEGAIASNPDPDTFGESGAAVGRRSDGSLVIAGGVHLTADAGGSSDAMHIAQFAVAALQLSPTLTPDASFGGRAPLQLKASLGAPIVTAGTRQCAASAYTYDRPCVTVRVTTSQPASAAVQITDGGHLLAHSEVALFTGGTSQVKVVLTALGRQLLRSQATHRVTVTVSATDLAGNAAEAVAQGELRGS